MPATKRFRRYSAAAGSVLFLALCLPAASGAEWRDFSPHIVRFIEVEPGVKLEVLDWGGKGQAVLLLAGHGDTAHIFDDLAPRLSRNFRVLALTRRGFGASAQPEQGYDLARLVQDIAQVVDALKLEPVHLVGHSIAGDEMTRFALTFPDKVGKLVYLDAAYDRVQARQVEASFPSLPPLPEPLLGSPEAIRAFVARTAILMPESEIRATRVFDSDERFLRPVTPNRIVNAVAAMSEHPDCESIQAPILAIFAVYQTPAQLAPRFKFADPTTRRALDRIFDMWRAFATAQRDSLRMRAPRAHIVELDGASHYLFISDRDRVLAAIRAFLQTPKKT